MNKQNERNIFQRMCNIYVYSKEAKTISFTSNGFNGKDLYEYLLFKYCFLKAQGAKFENITDILFLKTVECSKEELLLDIIDLFLCKIENKNTKRKNYQDYQKYYSISRDEENIQIFTIYIFQL